MSETVGEGVSGYAAVTMLQHRRAVRRSFAAWCVHRGYEPALHHQLIIRSVEEFLVGDDQVLLIFAPPGSAKSSFMSVLLPPWYLANHPKDGILFATHSVEFAERWGRRVRNDIAMEGKTLGIQLSDDNKAAGRWSLQSGGEYYAVGAGTGISGYRADLAIIDDPFGSREDAYSETVRKGRWNWYLDDFSARLKPGAKRVIIACMTGDTPVTMADGTYKRLEDIRRGDSIKAWKNGCLVDRNVLNHVSQGDDEVFEINTGNNRVRANARHPFLVQRAGGSTEWVKVADLKKGDFLLSSARMDSDAPARLTMKEAWLLGHMFGDGWVTIRDTVQKGRPRYTARDGTVRRYADAIYPRRGFVTCVALKEREEVNVEVGEAFQEIFGLTPKMTRFGYRRTDVAKVGRWFIENGLAGTAKTKRLPHWIFSQPLAIRMNLFRGFMAADGHVATSRGGRWTFALSNEGLVSDLRHLARSCGYRPSNMNKYVQTAQPPHSPAPVVSENYHVGMRLERVDDVFAVRKIRTIKPVGRAEVFDIQVDDAECFLADGLVASNTRWHEEDISGMVLQQIERKEISGKVISIAAIAEEGDCLGRAVGDYLWDDPGGYNYGEFLRARQRETSPMMWSALYQQRPAPEEGDYFKAEWIVECDDSELPARERLVVYGASDYAVTADGGDFTVHVVVGIDPNGRMYLLDVWRKQAGADQWVEAFCDLVKQWRPMAWAEEQGQIRAGVGPFLDRRQRERSAYVAREGFPTRGDKSVRAQSIRGRMALDKLYVPRAAKWWPALRSELLTFPAGKYDDQVDALGLCGQLLDVMVAGREAKQKKNVVNIGYRRLERQVEGFKTY